MLRIHAPKGILDRYKQIQPKFVFSETEVVYAGKSMDLLPKIAQVAQELRASGVRQLVLLPSTKTGKDIVVPVGLSIPNR